MLTLVFEHTLYALTNRDPSADRSLSPIQEQTMSKRIRCEDVGMDCDFAALADTESELLEIVREHAERVHGVEEVTPELRRKVMDAVEDV